MAGRTNHSSPSVERLVLLAGMDGTGRLFAPLKRALPQSLATTSITYPQDPTLGYKDLQRTVEDAAPHSEKYAILAESFSGPLAIEHAARQPTNLKAVILCGSFASNPLHPTLSWLSSLTAPLLFRLPIPKTVVRAVLLDPSSPPDLVDRVVRTIRSVSPEVLSRRLREITRVDVNQLN